MKVKLLDTRNAPASIRAIMARITRGHSPVIRVIRHEIPYWEARGWVRSGSRYTGNYQTPYGAFQGHCEQRGPGFFRFFIEHPPPELSRHHHWVCFRQRSRHRYEIHLARQPADVSSGIMTVERLLTEALEQGATGGAR